LQLTVSAMALGLAAVVWQPATGVAQSTTTGGPSALVPADLDFVLKAADDGMAEVALAQVAQQQAGSAEGKKFAQHMIDDHTKANKQLAQLAQERGLNPPQTPSESAQLVQKTMAAYQGPEFDEVYMAQQVGDHELAVALFTYASKHAQAPVIRDFAKKTLPTLQEHLKQAQSIHKKVAEKS